MKPSLSFPVSPGTCLPRHIGIIMDGNGRWAESRGLARREGHKEGLVAAKRVVKAAQEAGIGFLTLYVFSTENWKRTESEVNFLMFLLKDNLKKEYKFYKENGIRVVHSGDLARLGADIQKEILDVERDTAHHPGLTVNLAINYGGRNEIVRAVAKYYATGAKTPPTENEIEKFLDVPEIPDADLIIRTAGDTRLSNFLLWRSSYSELYFCQKFWPDWTEADLGLALAEYARRQRRFGGVEASPLAAQA